MPLKDVGRLQQRKEILQVLTAGKVGHHAAVFLVQTDLTVHPLTVDAAGRIKQREGGLIAGTFNG